MLNDTSCLRCRFSRRAENDEGVRPLPDNWGAILRGGREEIKEAPVGTRIETLKRFLHEKVALCAGKTVRTDFRVEVEKSGFLADCARPMNIEDLVKAASDARRLAYAPYSRFAVGAAVLAKDGSVFAGCNVENISYGLANCAERVAIFNAVSAGRREFSHLVIVADTEEPISPCGACRQVASEFSETLHVTSVTVSGRTLTWSIAELLPRPKAGILDVPRGTI